MGSDDGEKIEQRRRGFWSRLWASKRALYYISMLTVVLVLLELLLPPPELVWTPVFSPNVSMVPEQCRAKAIEFYQHQSQFARTSPWSAKKQHAILPVWTIAAHRRWCGSDGHCEPCGGIGDRMRFFYSMVEDAMAKNYAIQVDAPMNQVLRIVDLALYQDQYGWLAELARFRSYDVSQRERPTLRSNNNNNNKKRPNIFTHITPNHYQQRKFDPCWHHVLFQPTPEFQATMDHHNQAIDGIDDSSKNPSIGIHFRTGDATAFGIANKDSRVRQDQLESSLQKMLGCANELALELFPQLGSKPLGRRRITYYLATDNPQVKQMARELERNSTNSETIPFRIYTTEVVPGSYLSGPDGDADAWLEIYLLSMRSGLVVNQRPERDYAGKAQKISLFAVLASQIGFMDKDRQVKTCTVN